MIHLFEFTVFLSISINQVRLIFLTKELSIQLILSQHSHIPSTAHPQVNHGCNCITGVSACLLYEYCTCKCIKGEPYKIPEKQTKRLMHIFPTEKAHLKYKGNPLKYKGNWTIWHFRFKTSKQTFRCTYSLGFDCSMSIWVSKGLLGLLQSIPQLQNY